MSWKKLTDFIDKSGVILEVGEGSAAYRFQQSILLFEYINKPSYEGPVSAIVKVYPGTGYSQQITGDFAAREASKEEQAKLRDQYERRILENLRVSLGHPFATGCEVETFVKGKKKVVKHTATGCLEVQFRGLQKRISSDNSVSIKKKDGTLGRSVIRFSSGFNNKDRKQAIEALDGILAVACVALFCNYKSSLPKTPKIKTHIFTRGLSYNKISNAWAMHPLVGNLVIDLSRKVAMFGKKGLFKYWEATPKEIQQVLETNDVELARKILKRNKDLFVKILNAAYAGHNESNIEKLYKVFMKGIHKNIKTPFELSKNWLKESETDLDEVDDGYINRLQVGRNINDISKGKKF